MKHVILIVIAAGLALSCNIQKVDVKKETMKGKTEHYLNRLENSSRLSDEEEFMEIYQEYETWYEALNDQEKSLVSETKEKWAERHPEESARIEKMKEDLYSPADTAAIVTSEADNTHN